MDLTENPYHGQPRLFPGEITDSEGFLVGPKSLKRHKYKHKIADGVGLFSVPQNKQ